MSHENELLAIRVARSSLRQAQCNARIEPFYFFEGNSRNSRTRGNADFAINNLQFPHAPFSTFSTIRSSAFFSNGLRSVASAEK